MYDTTRPNKLAFAELAEMVRRAPYHVWLGIELMTLGEEDIVIRVPWREEFVSSVKFGYAHGGVLAALVDLAADFALAAKLGRGAPTVDLRVDYHRPALAGEMRAIGRVIKLGRTIATAEGMVTDADGKLLASGRAVFLPPQD
ncbi:MAG: PaaI family thioesterase [Alphaproteobacteria bacterium]|nr:PaaI family thioesterase [Alphaproteobacteria bacterium]